MNIADFIPTGKENAISKAELVRRLGIGEREVRKHIEKARARGEPILSSSHKNGYWISDNCDELEAYIKEAENRANSIHRANNLLKKKLYDLKGIKKVKVKEHYRRVNGGNCKEQLSMLH